MTDKYDLAVIGGVKGGCRLTRNGCRMRREPVCPPCSGLPRSPILSRIGRKSSIQAKLHARSGGSSP